MVVQCPSVQPKASKMESVCWWEPRMAGKTGRTCWWERRTARETGLNCQLEPQMAQLKVVEYQSGLRKAYPKGSKRRWESKTASQMGPMWW